MSLRRFSVFKVMYYSEYLRNKKLAAPQIVSPPRGRSGGLWTQMQRYKNSQIRGPPSVSASDRVLGQKGHSAVCCVDTIVEPTVLQVVACTPTYTYRAANWVSVGRDASGDTILYSEDGVTWYTARGTFGLSGGGGGYNSGFGVTYGGDKWVAVGVSDIEQNIQYSYDGIVWSPAVGSIPPFVLDVAYNGRDKWVAVGAGSVSSPNGVTWSATSTGFFENGLGFGVAYGNNTWVAVGFDSTTGSTIKTSPDGDTWSDASGGFEGGGFIEFGIGLGVAFGADRSGNPRWVAVGGSSNEANIKYSDDGGQSWLDASGSFDSLGGGVGVAYGNNMWVTVGFDGTNSGNNILFSMDGQTWFVANGSFGIGSGGGPSGGGPGIGQEVTYGNGVWTAVGYDASGQNILRSPDGMDWTHEPGSYFSEGAFGIAYSGTGSFEGKVPRGFYGPPKPDCCSEKADIVSRSNLIVNGTFSTGTLEGWANVTGCNLDVRLYSEGADDGPFSPPSPPSTPTYVARGGCVESSDSLTQTVPTLPGQSYTLSYYLYDDGGPGPIYFYASIAGVVQPSSVIEYSNVQTDPGFAWTLYSIPFTATSTSTEIAFYIQHDPAYFYLTDISVV